MFGRRGCRCLGGEGVGVWEVRGVGVWEVRGVGVWEVRV